MAENTQTTATISRDLDAMVEQTQPAALKLLDDAELAALMKELRGMKGQEIDARMRKALTEALRNAAAEKLLRMAQQPTKAASRGSAKKAEGSKAAKAKSGKPKAKSAEAKETEAGKAERLAEKSRKLAEKAEKLEAKVRKLAEKAEKARVKEAEKAERKGALAKK